MGSFGVRSNPGRDEEVRGDRRPPLHPRARCLGRDKTRNRKPRGGPEAVQVPLLSALFSWEAEGGQQGRVTVERGPGPRP